MTKRDSLAAFEALAAGMAEPPTPTVNVVPQVMRRIRPTATATDPTLTVVAAVSCCAALAVAVAGLIEVSAWSDPLEALLAIVPPIGP